VTAEVSRTEQWLKIIVYGKKVPNRLPVVQSIRSGIAKLNPTGVKVVRICGRIDGSKQDSWVEDLHLFETEVLSSKLPSANNFKSYGWLSLVIGGLILGWSLLYSPAVDGTYNIGKISDREVFADIGLAGVISGTILLVYGDYRDSKDR
jgi:hypothetical protein